MSLLRTGPATDSCSKHTMHHHSLWGWTFSYGYKHKHLEHNLVPCLLTLTAVMSPSNLQTSLPQLQALWPSPPQPCIYDKFILLSADSVLRVALQTGDCLLPSHEIIAPWALLASHIGTVVCRIHNLETLLMHYHPEQPVENFLALWNPVTRYEACNSGLVWSLSTLYQGVCGMQLWAL